MTSKERPFADPYRSMFLEVLGRITNTIPSIIESKVIAKDDLPKHPINFKIIDAQGEDVL